MVIYFYKNIKINTRTRAQFHQAVIVLGTPSKNVDTFGANYVETAYHDWTTVSLEAQILLTKVVKNKGYMYILIFID